MKCLLIPFGLLALSIGDLAKAWPVAHYSDSQLVDKAQIIVIANVKQGSLSLTQYPAGGDYVSHAVLIVTTVLKGESKTREIPIILAYGLLPVPVRLKDKIAGVDDILKEFPKALNEKGAVLLFEDNPSEGCTLISNDVYQDQIWLLRPGKIRVSQVPSPNMPGFFQDVIESGIGVWDPQDVEPIVKENDLKKLIK